MNYYFITGATGAIGAALVPLLIEEQDISVFLLIRAKDDNHLKERLHHLFEFWKLEETDEKIKRISPVTGDIRFPNFGIEDDKYKDISEKCTHIIHCAGNVRMNLSIEKARRYSVDSAKNVISLGNVCIKNKNLKKIEFVSTVGVGGRMQGPVVEDWIDQKREFHNTYEQAKAEAEDYVKTQVDKGLPITIHRPSMVVGDSKNGKIIHFQVFYYLCDFLSGRKTLGIIPTSKHFRLDTIPVDYVAKAIKWSSRNPKSQGYILHECSGPQNSILLSDLRQIVIENFIKNRVIIPIPKTIPVWLFKVLLPCLVLFAPPKIKRAIKVLPVFFNYISHHVQDFENDTAVALLKREGIQLPNVKSYLKINLDAYLKDKQKFEV